MKRIVASVEAKVTVVCPACGEVIEVKLEGQWYQSIRVYAGKRKD